MSRRHGGLQKKGTETVRDGQDNCEVQSSEGQGQRRACWRKGAHTVLSRQ